MTDQQGFPGPYRSGVTAGSFTNANITVDEGGRVTAAANGSAGASVIDSIADSDTTNAPSRNAVFDALALKADASTVSALVVDSIADADTTHAPSRNAVFDALALKANSSALATVATSGAYADLSGTPTLGTAAAQNTGTSGANVPLLNGANTWGAAQTFGASLTTSAGVVWASSATAPAQITTAQAGSAYTITASAAVAGSSVAGAAAGGSVTITAGAAARLTSGNANGGDIVLVPGAGIGTGTDGQVLFSAGVVAKPSIAWASATGTGFWQPTTNSIAVSVNGAAVTQFAAATVRSSSATVVGWTAGLATAVADTGMARNGAGITESNNGTAGTLRDHKLRNLLAGGGNGSYVQTPSMTVANLPTAATAGAGGRAFVTDATATTFLSTVAGGGANKVPVVSDGTNWLIG